MASNMGPFVLLPLQFRRGELDAAENAPEREGNEFVTRRTRFAP